MSSGTSLPAPSGAGGQDEPSGSLTATPTRRGIEDGRLELRSAARAAGPGGRGSGSTAHERPPDGHDPERLAHAVARVFLEVEVGRRPLHQLNPVLAPALRARLEMASRRPGPGPTLDAVMAVRSSRPHPDACDAAVVVRRGERVGVIVVRLERHQAAWRVVELARPEDRPLPRRRVSDASVSR